MTLKIIEIYNVTGIIQGYILLPRLNVAKLDFAQGIVSNDDLIFNLFNGGRDNKGRKKTLELNPPMSGFIRKQITTHQGRKNINERCLSTI